MNSPAEFRRAVFLDRDGVINVDHGYVGRWEDFEFIPGAVDAMRRLHEAGWLLVVVTNQSGIARGYYTEADYEALTARMRAELFAAGAPLAGVYHCPHLRNSMLPAYAVDCDCRKPKPGMILRAAGELGIALQASALVGDKISDLAAARTAGIPAAFLADTANEAKVLASKTATVVWKVRDLAEAVQYLISQHPDANTRPARP